MVTIDRILQLAKERGIKQTYLNSLIGGYRGKITDWKNGKSTPNENELKIIADYFNVSVDYLKGKTDTKKELDTTEGIKPEVLELAKMMASLPDDDYRVVKKILESMVHNNAE